MTLDRAADRSGTDRKDAGMSRTKIVATIGPRTSDVDLLRRLVEAGMDVARINGAHADSDWHSATIDLLRRVAPHVPVLLDLPGRKVRTGELEPEPSFDAGDLITFTTADVTSDSGAMCCGRMTARSPSRSSRSRART
jgi:pyruvate kinase